MKEKNSKASNKRPKLSASAQSSAPARASHAVKGSAKKVEVESADESNDSSDDSEEGEDSGSEEGEEEKEEDLAHMFYFFAKSQIESGESKTFPKALAALNKVKSIVMQRNADLRKLIEKALKRDESDTRVPPGSALVQRTLTDERFLMCITNVLISKVELCIGNSKGAADALREALIWFPRCIEANYLLAEIYRSNAENEERLLQVQALLAKAIETGTHLREKFKETTRVAKEASRKAAADVTKTGASAEEAEETGELTEEELVMEIEADELAAAAKAQECLSIVLCQSGRFDAAFPHLDAQGFKWRLSKEVFNYPLPGETDRRTTAPAGATSIVKAFDNAVNSSVVAHLQSVFRPDSPFWSEHNYDTVLNASATAGYFSYLYPLKERSPVCSIEQIIQQYIYPAVCEQFPQAAEANIGTYKTLSCYSRPLALDPDTHFFPCFCCILLAEWWVHSRPHSNGHQLHFDSDETRIMSGRAPAHPLVSSVLYLNDTVGGPTVVTNQRLAGPLATEGWMVMPKLNRMVMFDSQYLHGVIPGRGCNPLPHQNQRRLTFMVGFWKEIAAKDRGLDNAGPGQPFPDATRTKYTWPREMQLAGEVSGSVFNFAGAGPSKAAAGASSASTGVAEAVDPIYLSAIWEPVDSGLTAEGTGTEGAVKKVPSTVAATPHYSTCFQGF